MTPIAEMTDSVKNGYYLMLQADSDWVAWQTIRDGLKIPIEFVTSRPMTDAEVGKVVRGSLASQKTEASE